MANQTLQALTEVDESAYFRLRLIVLAKFLARLQSLIKGNPQFIRHGLHNAVHFTKRHIEDSPYVPENGSGRQGSESNNLCYMILTVFTGNVIDNPATIFIAEIHINIGHGDTFRIQKPFKKQIVF